jgi:hypothetical protein
MSSSTGSVADSRTAANTAADPRTVLVTPGSTLATTIRRIREILAVRREGEVMPNEEAVPKDTEPDDDAPLRVEILCTRSRSRSRSPRRPSAAEMMTAATASLQQTIAAWRNMCLQAEAELEDMEERVEEQLQRVEDLVDECDDLRGYSKNLEAELDSWVSLLGQRRELQSIERESMPELQHISLEGCKQVFAKKAFEL